MKSMRMSANEAPLERKGKRAARYSLFAITKLRRNEGRQFSVKDKSYQMYCSLFGEVAAAVDTTGHGGKRAKDDSDEPGCGSATLFSFATHHASCIMHQVQAGVLIDARFKLDDGSNPLKGSFLQA